MSLDARAIALQGLGFATLLVAVQGFAPAPVTSVLETPRYSIDTGAVQRAHRRQQFEEDEVILACIQQFVMEA